MKYYITILILFYPFISPGQSTEWNKSSLDEYKKVPALTCITVPDTAKLAGLYTIDAGFEGLLINLKPNGSFNEFAYSCTGKDSLDSGVWIISKTSLVLKNATRNEVYDLVTYQNHLFLVPVLNRKTFIKEFKIALHTAKESYDNQLKLSALVVMIIKGRYYHKHMDM